MITARKLDELAVPTHDKALIDVLAAAKILLPHPQNGGGMTAPQIDNSKIYNEISQRFLHGESDVVSMRESAKAVMGEFEGRHAKVFNILGRTIDDKKRADKEHDLVEAAVHASLRRKIAQGTAEFLQSKGLTIGSECRRSYLIGEFGKLAQNSTASYGVGARIFLYPLAPMAASAMPYHPARA